MGQWYSISPNQIYQQIQCHLSTQLSLLSQHPPFPQRRHQKALVQKNKANRHLVTQSQLLERQVFNLPCQKSNAMGSQIVASVALTPSIHWKYLCITPANKILNNVVGNIPRANFLSTLSSPSSVVTSWNFLVTIKTVYHFCLWVLNKSQN